MYRTKKGRSPRTKGIGILYYMGVSKNSGTPKSSHFNRVFPYKPSILGYCTTIFGNIHIYQSILFIYSFFSNSYIVIVIDIYIYIHMYGRISKLIGPYNQSSFLDKRKHSDWDL